MKTSRPRRLTRVLALFSTLGLLLLLAPSAWGAATQAPDKKKKVHKPQFTVAVSPSPLLESGESEIRAVVQVHANPEFAGDVVNIFSTQLVNICGGGFIFGSLQPGAVHGPGSIGVILDADGNVTVMLYGLNCAPGKAVIVAPFLSATTKLVMEGPTTSKQGLIGYPADEIETGDTTATGESDVYAVFFLESRPVYAEATVTLTSQEMASRCAGTTAVWMSDNGVSNGDSVT